MRICIPSNCWKRNSRLSDRILLLCLSAALAAAQQVPSIGALAQDTIKEWKVPGLALAVIEDGKLVHQAGYGFRDAATRLPVSTKTVFGIGSITKSFTVLALLSLAREGKIDFDQPVRQYLPEFQLKDPTASSLATLRDLVSHRTGMPRHDSLWSGPQPPASIELISALRHLEPTRGFREAYQYNNLMFLAAGTAGARASGMSWERLIRERVFAPAGIQDGFTSWTASLGHANLAEGYTERDGSYFVVPGKLAAAAVDAIAPAGAIRTHIEDLTRYLQLHMERRHFPPRAFAAMQRPHILSATGELPGPYPGELSYGMGLVLGSHRGRKTVSHTGTYGGHHGLIWWMPEERFGVAVLLNRVAREVPAILALTLADRYLKAEARDWNAYNKTLAEAARGRLEKSRAEVLSKRVSGTSPSRPLAAFEGRYTHPGYGPVDVAAEEGKLRLRHNGRSVAFSHFHYDVFSLDTEEGIARIRFTGGIDGTIEELHWRIEPAGAPVLFQRTTPASRDRL
jgi:CubicO group peptidase (beta-lactamase class C family)